MLAIQSARYFVAGLAALVLAASWLSRWWSLAAASCGSCSERSSGSSGRLMQVSTVDPRLPAPYLVEDLLEATEGAFRVWDENDDTDPPADDIADVEWDAREATRRTTFAYLVVDAATEHKTRLGSH